MEEDSCDENSEEEDIIKGMSLTDQESWALKLLGQQFDYHQIFSEKYQCNAKETELRDRCTLGKVARKTYRRTTCSAIVYKLLFVTHTRIKYFEMGSY